MVGVRVTAEMQATCECRRWWSRGEPMGVCSRCLRCVVQNFLPVVLL